MLPALPILDLLQDCCDPPLTPETLEILLEKIGKRFPQEYAEFLLQFNGGHFVRPVGCSIPHPTDYVTGVGMESFIGEPNDGYGHNGLVWYAELVLDRMPREYLPIAHANGSDYVVLKLTGPDSHFEGVWHWDSSAFWNEDDDPEFYWLADTFFDFLGMLVHETCYDDDEQETLPLFQSVERGGITAIEQYLAEGGDVEARNAHGHTLLMAAAIYRWPKLVPLLLDHAANPNQRDHAGCSALHHAAVHSTDSVKLLLAAGADATARDDEGNSVLGNWCYRADQIMREHGAVE